MGRDTIGRIAEKSFADHRSWFARLQIVLSAVLLIVSCATPASSVSTTSSAKTTTPSPKPQNSGLTYPRTATTFLDQHELPTIDELARYDVVVIDNEWANRKPRSFFDELHARNPRLKLLAYVNVVDSVHQTGTQEYWPNTYKMWQISPSDSRVSTFPDEWLAHTAVAPPSTNGKTA